MKSKSNYTKPKQWNPTKGAYLLAGEGFGDGTGVVPPGGGLPQPLQQKHPAEEDQRLEDPSPCSVPSTARVRIRSHLPPRPSPPEIESTAQETNREKTQIPPWIHYYQPREQSEEIKKRERIQLYE